MSKVLLSELLASQSHETQHAHVELSNELVPLLSEQLYRSPIKAIEELVVNSYDAAANDCKLFVPDPTEQASLSGRHYVVVFDDGDGMSVNGLVDLWHVGRSPKTGLRVHKSRKQIGKFGIGKIATYAIADRLTYLTKSSGNVLTSSLDFRKLMSDAEIPESKRVPVPVSTISSWSAVMENAQFSAAIEAAGATPEDFEGDSWTLAILEDLKDAAAELRIGRLKWVLRTAMPLKTAFDIHLNHEKLSSAKSDFRPSIEFEVKDLKPKYIRALNDEFKTEWRAKDGTLKSKRFPEGVTGTVQVFDRSLFGTKSDDLERSHGFFVRVRDRLVNLEDPLFGTTDLTHKYFSRFCADVNADDLDRAVKAAREGIDVSSQRQEFVALLRALFNDARSQYDEQLARREQEAQGKLEDSRHYVPRELVERPLADVLSPAGSMSDGADADRSWFYIEIGEEVNVEKLVEQLYTADRAG